MQDKKVKLAVYDFDGTSITGNSPVLLVRRLSKSRKLRPSVTARILAWAVAYKLRLPQSESWVRGLVFTAFLGQPKNEVDNYLAAFYDEVLEPRFRKQAQASMLEDAAEGCTIMVVSATFEPIVARAMEFHPFQYQLSTRMSVDDQGNYLARCEGTPVEGEEKVAVITRFADGLYGPGNWVLEKAYGDHHSDTTMLSSANRAFAVTPDKPLLRRAKRNGWTVLNWD